MCENTTSTLHRLEICMRCTVAKDRITGLATFHIHYDAEVDTLKPPLSSLPEIHPRRMQLVNIPNLGITMQVCYLTLFYRGLGGPSWLCACTSTTPPPPLVMVTICVLHPCLHAIIMIISSA